jgi:hypothetical protein
MFLVSTKLIGGATLLTTDLLYKTITLSTSNIYTISKNIFYSYSYNFTNINQLYRLEKELDLLETIRLYELWLKELLENHKDSVNSSPSLIESINSISNILDEFHNILKSIDNKLEEHKTKWFYSWRTLDFTNESNLLKINKIILDNRINILKNLLIALPLEKKLIRFY